MTINLCFNFDFQNFRYDSHSRSYNNAIRLLGDNDDEFSSTSANKPEVEIDGCKVRRIYKYCYCVNKFDLINCSFRNCIII